MSPNTGQIKCAEDDEFWEYLKKKISESEFLKNEDFLKDFKENSKNIDIFLSEVITNESIVFAVETNKILILSDVSKIFEDTKTFITKEIN